MNMPNSKVCPQASTAAYGIIFIRGIRFTKKLSKVECRFING